MNKKIIIEQLIKLNEDELLKAKEAFETTKSLTTDGETNAESKWDTRSIEAGYLAGAQKLRVDEIELDLKLLKDIGIEGHSSRGPIAIGSLVELEFNSNRRKYFISSTSGGSMIKVKDETILVISAFSPIGAEVIGLCHGDEFEVLLGKNTREYLITAIS